ncbi:hypothetical protein [Bradymonas sediminis]|uniref:Uncharacterized protein n=1 Tax=Bradymonas sediminis TaxID=1548548 RepID=A0A2Z4FNR9_9DELT|nr:hypothetical protein [Bradymonas sediminis]AWV90593.1 hypothetical protein DN745_15170 [Bradymonas sediminis]TDP62410.1 hypothetical protein DFR33_11373 [Bradymonas sediminis]
MANDLKGTLNKLAQADGFIAASLVDIESGMTLGSIGGGEKFDVEVAGATNSTVVKAKLRAAEALGLDDKIEDILISLTSQYHLIRLLPDRPNIFVYMALNRQQSNLAMARLLVTDATNGLKL